MTFELAIGKRKMRVNRPISDTHQLFIDDSLLVELGSGAVAEMRAHDDKLSVFARALDRAFCYLGVRAPDRASAHILNGEVVWYENGV